MNDPGTSLGGGFDPRDIADWQALIGDDLRVGDPARLVSRTEDGLEVRPLYTSGDFLTAPPRAAETVRRLGHIGAEANGRIAEAVTEELGHGATGVFFELSTPAHSDGLAVEPADWAAVFDAVQAEGSFHLHATADVLAHARAWLECGMGNRTGCELGLDPFRVVTRSGDFDGLDESLASAARLGAEALTHPARPRAFALDAQPYSSAGASCAQSLACLLSALVQTLRALEVANVDPARALQTVGLCLRLDPHFFEQIAALRALRLLHGRVAGACGVESAAPLHLTALPDDRMLSRRDPWVNMLRQTSTSFAALVGGADAVGAIAYDAKLETSSVLGRRIARNTPLILAEESRLGLVQDPAAGSWFLDSMTRELAAAAWEFFQSIEAQGGLGATLKSGWLLERLQAQQVERQERLVRRKQSRTGVSEFARIDEELPAAVAAAASLVGGAWPRHGFDDAFETLRAAADRHTITHARPSVFLARTGSPAQYSAREAWLTNLVAAAGIEAIASDHEREMAAGFVASGAATAILTGDDDSLAAEGPALARALGKFGTVWAVGRPSTDLEAAGVSGFVHLGIDVVDVLGELLTEQGVQR